MGKKLRTLLDPKAKKKAIKRTEAAMAAVYEFR